MRCVQFRQGRMASSCWAAKPKGLQNGLSALRRRTTALTVCCKQKTTSGRKGEQQQKGKKEPPPNKLDVLMRKHPILSRFYDTKLILGEFERPTVAVSDMVQ